MAGSWIASDTAAMLSTDDFASSVTLNGVSVNAIFDEDGEVANVGLAGAVVRRPMLGLATSDVPSSPDGKTAVIGGVSYRIVEHLPDGTGWSQLILERA